MLNNSILVIFEIFANVFMTFQNISTVYCIRDFFTLNGIPAVES